EARVALTLRLLGGLTTDEIARAFLVPEATLAQRIVRAKRTLTEARVPFEVPRGDELAARLSSVLQVVYLVFNEGYSATAGDDWVRPALGADGRGDGLAAHRRALRHARPPNAVAGRGAEPRGRGGDGVRAGGRARDRRHADDRARARRLSPLAERARRLPDEARPLRRSED